MQDRLCHWLTEKGEEEVADWFSVWWCGPVKGRWLLGNGGSGFVANGAGTATPSAEAVRYGG